MLVVGLTGGIGAGKTEVADILRKLGAVVIESDKVAHLSYLPGTEAYKQIVHLFGKGVLDETGVIDRKTLGKVVFSDAHRRAELEAIVWPAAREWIEARLAQEKERGTRVTVIEVPKLFEAGWDQLVDVVWTVEAPASEIARRVEQRSGLGESETAARAAAQLTRTDRTDRADSVIENDGTLDDLRERVGKVWDLIPTVLAKTESNPQ